MSHDDPIMAICIAHDARMNIHAKPLAYAALRAAHWRQVVRTLKRERKALIQAAHTAHGSPGFLTEAEERALPEPTERCWKRQEYTAFDGPQLIDVEKWCPACKAMAAKTAELRVATRKNAGAGRSLDYAAKRFMDPSDRYLFRPAPGYHAATSAADAPAHPAP